MKPIILKSLIILLISFPFFCTAQDSGTCSISAIASCGPCDRNTSCTSNSFISIKTGANPGTGDCVIPSGAIITTCRVTLSNPAVTPAGTPLNHIQVSISSGSAGATNRLDVIGSGLTINFDALGGCPVDGLVFNASFIGTFFCGNTHNHTAQVNVSVQLGWMVPEGIFYQPTTGLQDTYLGNCMTNLNNAATRPYVFADNGTQSSGGFYTNNINYIYRSFCPDAIGKCISANVEYYQLENPNDFLWLLNGPTQNSTQIATLTGAKSWGTPVTYTSSDSSGCLSFRFNSNFANVYGGFFITLQSVNCAVARSEPYTDCEGAIATCGNRVFTGSSNGPGLVSSCQGCVVSENYTSWYFFEVTGSGLLSMTIDAIDNADDYDFSLYRSANCGSLGDPVRCSYASITANGNTGMAAGYTDASETATGNGWVNQLAVSPGEKYVLMVNNWSPNDNGFILNFFLSSGAGFKDCDDITLPVEMLSFQGECSNGKSKLYWTTATETNNDYFTIMKSINNTVYKPVGYVLGAGNSNTLTSYYFEDPEENNGTVYYKVKQTDFDGNAQYSNLISVECEAKDLDHFTVNNLQDNGYVNILFDAVSGKSYLLQLISASGNIVFSTDYTAQSNIGTYDIPIAKSLAGIYIIRVISTSNEEIAKLMIY